MLMPAFCPGCVSKKRSCFGLDYAYQLVWMLFLKIFDAKEEEYELDPDYQSPIPEKLRWRDWAEDDEGITGDELAEFINNKLFPKLKEINVSQHSDPRGYVVQQVFADSFNYMKKGTLIRQVVNKINEIDFHDMQERHLFNDIYEKILRDLQSAGNAGEQLVPWDCSSIPHGFPYDSLWFSCKGSC